MSRDQHHTVEVIGSRFSRVNSLLHVQNLRLLKMVSFRVVLIQNFLFIANLGFKTGISSSVPFESITISEKYSFYKNENIGICQYFFSSASEVPVGTCSL